MSALAATPTPAGVPPYVDVPAAKEMLEQIHRHVGRDELRVLVDALEGKAAAMRALLGPVPLDGSRARRAIALSFVGRRRALPALAERADCDLAAWIAGLHDERQPLASRFERFCAAGPLAGGPAAELASELLHFGDLERYWLWSRWIWSPESRTGALALLIGEEFDLATDLDRLGEGYERVGEAMRVLDASPEVSALRSSGGGRLASDVLLACTYAIYMRTVLGMKMTQQFTTILPPVPALVRRLLGTHARPSGQES
jgi:hypothetical protein